MSFFATYVLNELFDRDNLECKCNADKIHAFDLEWMQVQSYLLYFFTYRANSPKTIEAFLRGSILHPVWLRNKDVGLTWAKTIKNFKVHIFRTIGVLVAIVCGSLTFLISGISSESILNFISGFSTLLSIVLSVIAFF